MFCVRAGKQRPLYVILLIQPHHVACLGFHSFLSFPAWKIRMTIFKSDLGFFFLTSLHLFPKAKSQLDRFLTWKMFICSIFRLFSRQAYWCLTTAFLTPQHIGVCYIKDT